MLRFDFRSTKLDGSDEVLSQCHRSYVLFLQHKFYVLLIGFAMVSQIFGRKNRPVFNHWAPIAVGRNLFVVTDIL